MKTIDKTIIYCCSFLGIVSFFGSSILTITCLIYILMPNSSGNKFFDKLPIIVLNTSFWVILSTAICLNVLPKLSEIQNVEQDQKENKIV